MSSGSKRETGRLFVCCIVPSAYPLEIPSDCQAVQQETLMFPQRLVALICAQRSLRCRKTSYTSQSQTTLECESNGSFGSRQVITCNVKQQGSQFTLYKKRAGVEAGSFNN